MVAQVVAQCISEKSEEEIPLEKRKLLLLLGKLIRANGPPAQCFECCCITVGTTHTTVQMYHYTTVQCIFVRAVVCWSTVQ